MSIKAELADVVLLTSKYVMAASKMPVLIDKCIRENIEIDESMILEMDRAMDKSLDVCELSEEVIDIALSDIPESEKEMIVKDFEDKITSYISELDELAEYLKMAKQVEPDESYPLPVMLLS